jgi:hypothetical protein
MKRFSGEVRLIKDSVLCEVRWATATVFVRG